MSMHQTIGQTETRGFHDDYLDSLALVECNVVKDEFRRLRRFSSSTSATTR
jgi:hypothetical protein